MLPDQFAPDPTSGGSSSDTTTDGATGAGPHRSGDPIYGLAIIDLLGVLAYGKLMTYRIMSADTAAAPDLGLAADLASFAVAEFHHYESIVGRLTALGADPVSAMAPFRGAIDAYHDRTAAHTWLERLVKAYVGDGISSDFFGEMGALLDPRSRYLVELVVESRAKEQFVVAVVRDAIRHDRRVADRLALWARRLVGEAITQAQTVAADRDALAGLIVGRGADLGEIGRILSRLTDAHTTRMERLGLSA